MTWTWIARVIDTRDRSRARGFQASFGRRGWLLSWRLGQDGVWRAGLSSPEWPRTISTRGRSRCEAIHRAELVHRILVARSSPIGWNK